MKLRELRVWGVTPLKKAVLDLDYEGITVIRGLNKDAGPKVTNAAGKSALVGSLPDLILDESPTGKDLKGNKKKISLLLDDSNGDTYEVSKTSGRKAEKSYDIIKNGKSLDVRTVKYSQQRIRNMFGASDAQFYSRIYLDSTIPHPLIVGGGRTGRQDYIVELFNLNSIDTLRKLLNAELTALTKKGVELRTLQSALQEVKDELRSKEERLADKAELEELTQKRDKLSVKVEKLQRLTELASVRKANAPLIKAVKEICELEDVPAKLKQLKAKLQEARNQSEVRAEWTTWRTALKSWKSRANPVTTELEALGLSREECKEQAEAYRDAMSAMRALGDFEDPGEPPAAPYRPPVEKSFYQNELSKLSHELKHAEKMQDGTCPTCGSRVRARPISAIRREIDEHRKMYDAAVKYEKHLHAMSDWEEAQSTYAKKRDQRAELKKKIQQGKDAYRVYEALRELPAKPKKPETPEPEGAAVDVQALSDVVVTLRRAFEMHDVLLEADSMTEEQLDASKSVADILSRMNGINSKISALTVRVASQIDLLRRGKKLKERVDALEEECKDEKILKALVQAHSSSGLKKFMVERYAKILEGQINKYSRIFFPEDYTFEFQYGSKLDLLVHRSYGNKTSPSDVRKLSGAEKRLFTLLLFVATSTMIPKEKRCNVLILDEPEANMGEDFTAKLVSTLPLIRKLVPHIVYVTPQSKLEIPDARIFTVVKKGGVATLVKGGVK